MLASRYSNKDSTDKTVEMLLEGGADPNLQTKKGWTALMLASRYSNKDSTERTVEMLLERGAVPDFSDNKSMIKILPLMYKKCQEVNTLKRRIEELEMKVNYAPGGDGYLEAKDHFNSMV